MKRASQAPRATQGSAAAPAEPLSWEYAIPVLNNPFLWYDYAKLLLIAAVVVEGLGLVTTYLIDGEPFLVPLQVWLIPAGILVVLFLLVGLIVRNRTPARFTLDAKEATYEAVSRMDRYERTVNRVAGVLGLLTGGLEGAGAKVFGLGGNESIPWKEVARVNVHRRLRVITLADSWHAVIRLYCPAESFDAILGRVQAWAAEGAAWRAKHPEKHNHRPLWFYVVWVVASVAATLACGGWYPGAYRATDRIGLACGVLVLLSGVLIRYWWGKLFAYLAAPVVLLYLVKLALAAWEPASSSHPEWGHSYTIDTPLLALAAVGGLVLAGLTYYRVRGVGDKW